MMKQLLLFICFMVFVAVNFAQYPNTNPSPRLKWSRTDDSIFRSKAIFFKSKPDTGIDKDILPYNGMPNAFTRKNPPDIYVGNNGQGQDIYQSQLDNMSILKPDSSFQSNMPTIGAPKPAIKTYPGFGVLPPADYSPPKNRKPPSRFK